METSVEAACRVYVGNLLPRAKEVDLTHKFARFGTIHSVWIARRPPGFAFVHFARPEEAKRAVEGSEQEDMEILGKTVRVQLAGAKKKEQQQQQIGSRDSIRESVEKRLRRGCRKLGDCGEERDWREDRWWSRSRNSGGGDLRRPRENERERRRERSRSGYKERYRRDGAGQGSTVEMQERRSSSGWRLKRREREYSSSSRSRSRGRSRGCDVTRR
uniref:RRM domain-containing protein n=1 Tax=Hyaloperonospora arabidopsidis (strain Emoy2) TaxID=559515 RepID=M4BCT8_HYAAE